MSNDKELIWVPRNIAEQFKKAESPEEKDRVILDACKSMKNAVQCEIDSLDEEVLRIRGAGAKARQMIKEAFKEHEEKSYAEWEAFDKKMHDLHLKMTEIKKIIEPVEKAVKELNTQLDSLPVSRMEYVLENLTKIQNFLNGPCGDEIKEYIQFQANNQKQTP